MGDFLAEMADASERRAAEALSRREQIQGAADAATPPPAIDLTTGRFELIAEVKLRAPSVGQLAAPADPAAACVAQASTYARAGAAVISVLTEPDRFDGHLSYLSAVAESVTVPAMRKDFLLHPVQIVEAKAHGASGALLITAMLSDDQLDVMIQTAANAKLFLLIEAFDKTDLLRTSAAIARRQTEEVDLLVGINVRNLRTLQVDTDRLARLAEHLPSGFPAVAESGIVRPEDAARAASLGYQFALVGSALMGADDSLALAQDLIAAGRDALELRQ